MDRNFEQLIAEAEKVGMPVRMEWSKDELENSLRDFYWKRDHAGETMLRQVDPMLAEKFNKLTEEKQAQIWTSRTWVAQLKLNGGRLIMHVNDKGNRFTTRGKSVIDFLFGETTHNLPFHRDLRLPDLNDTILDGEIISPYAVVKTKHTTTRKPLQAVMAVISPNSSEGEEIQNKYGPMEYHVFDIIRFQGRDVTDLPYEQRLELLKAAFIIINKTEAGPRLMKNVPVVYDNKEAYFNELVLAGEEGVLLKDLTSRYYLGGRPSCILKAKRFEELDAFVVGFKPGKEGKALEDVVGALVFAVIDEATGKQNIIGAISGLPMEFRRAATLPCDPIAVPADKEFVYTNGELVAKKGGTRTINYRLNPEFLGKVAMIQGLEFTPRNFKFAHCRFSTAYTKSKKFHPWREDKRPSECVEDIAKIAEKAGLVEA